MADEHDADLDGALPGDQGTIPAKKGAVIQPKAEVPPSTLVPDLNLASGEGLDNLLKEHEDVEAAALETADEKAEAEKKAADDAAAAETPEQKLAREKEEADKIKAAKEAEAARKPDALDAVTLPPHAKPKSVEAFDKIKQVAREQVIAVSKELEDTKKKLEVAEAAAKSAPPPEALKELEDLRTWRKHADIESAPEFKAFDSQVAKNLEQVYGKLTEAGMPPENLAKIKELGGPVNVDMEPILEKMSPTVRRYIEAKLIDNESLADKKKDAIEAAKKDAENFFKGKKDAAEKTTAATVETEKKTVDAVLKLVPWMTEPKAPDNATEDQKKGVENHKAFITSTRERIDAALKDRSPESRAEAVVGTQWAYWYKTQFELAHAKRLEAEKLLAERTAELDKIKKASGAGSRVSSARAPAAAAPGGVKIGVRGEDALDALRAEAESQAA